EAVLAGGGDRLLHLRLRLVRAPVGRVVALDDLHAGLLERLLRAALVRRGVGVGGRAVDHHHAGAGGLRAELGHQALGLLLAPLAAAGSAAAVARAVGRRAAGGDDRAERGQRDGGGDQVPRWHPGLPWGCEEPDASALV